MDASDLAAVIETSDVVALQEALAAGTAAVDTPVETPRGRCTLLEAVLRRGDATVVMAVLALPGTDPLAALPAHGTWAWMQEAQPDVIHAFLDHPGVDAQQADADGRTALIELAAGERTPPLDIADRLIAAGGSDHTAADGTTAFVQATLHRHFGLADRLLAAHADPNAANRLNGWTALITAVALGLDDVVAWLLSIDALDPGRTDVDGATALHHAARLGASASLAALLADPRVDPDAIDRQGRTPLEEAVQNGHTQAARMVGERATKTDSQPVVRVPAEAADLGHPHRWAGIPHRVPPRELP